MPKLPYQKIHPGHLFITHSRYDPALYISIWFHCSAYLFAFISNLKVGDPSSCTGHLLPWLMSLEIALLHICRLHNKSWFAFFWPTFKGPALRWKGEFVLPWVCQKPCGPTCNPKSNLDSWTGVVQQHWKKSSTTWVQKNDVSSRCSFHCCVLPPPVFLAHLWELCCGIENTFAISHWLQQRR